jgi:hypothetical protein
MSFDELIIRDATLSNINFANCQFKNSYMGFNSEYINCSFNNCTFAGKYSSFGSAQKNITRYTHCTFTDCKFKGLELFSGVKFEKCLFSGLFQNLILRGQSINRGVRFVDCDLKKVTFDNISIYGIDIFSNTELPSFGIRLYSNEENSLIERAKHICSKVAKNHRIEAEVIFDEGLHFGQKLIILDDNFMNTFFRTKESREVFDEIVAGFLIDMSKDTCGKAWNI